jgi:hypothetical protein
MLSFSRLQLPEIQIDINTHCITNANITGNITAEQSSQTQTPEMDFDQSGGHVFVLHGYLGKISCDAWLVPTDTNLRTDGWDLPPFDGLVKPGNWGLGINDKSEQRVMKYGKNVCDQNTPWLVLCSLTDQEQRDSQLPNKCEWYIEGVRMFLKHVSKDLEEFASDGRRYSPANRRSKPLVLLPVVGTGDGGYKDQTGHVIRELLRELWRCSKELQFDIGVVTRQPSKVSKPFC